MENENESLAIYSFHKYQRKNKAMTLQELMAQQLVLPIDQIFPTKSFSQIITNHHIRLCQKTVIKAVFFLVVTHF